MRMLLPPVAQRREMDRKLVQFFHAQRPLAFRRAIADFCRFYHIKTPKIDWYEYIDWGKTAGKTFEDGRIHLVHPENWKRGRIYNSERMWVQMVYHELAHYLFWTDAETKADAFMLRMVRGLRRPVRPRRSRTVNARATTAQAARRRATRARGVGRAGTRGRRVARRAALR